MTRIRRLLPLALMIIATSCEINTVYDRYEHTPTAGWERNDTLTFYIPPVKREGQYREEIGLRTNGQYPFQSLCLVVEQSVMPRQQPIVDTLFCTLIDRKGNVKGRGVSVYQYRFHLNTISMNEGDSIRVKIRHNMKREILPGISDVGIRLALEK